MFMSISLFIHCPLLCASSVMSLRPMIICATESPVSISTGAAAAIHADRSAYLNLYLLPLFVCTVTSLLIWGCLILP